MQVWDRSSMAKKGIHHFGGALDSDYRGELSVLLFNSTKEPFFISKGERIVQVKILPILQADFETVDELSNTSRGEGGFGSTGK